MGRARRRLGSRTDGYNIFRIITRFLGIIEKMNHSISLHFLDFFGVVRYILVDYEILLT